MSRVGLFEVPSLYSLVHYDADLTRHKTYFHPQLHLSVMTVLGLTLEMRQCHCTSKWLFIHLYISIGKIISEKTDRFTSHINCTTSHTCFIKN